MLGIAEMFAELDGYERYEEAVENWARATCEAREARAKCEHLKRAQAAWYMRNRDKQIAYHRRYYREVVRPLRGIGSRPVAQHGTVSKYNTGCRCEQCGDAARDYRRQYKKRVKEQPRLLERKRLRDAARYKADYATKADFREKRKIYWREYKRKKALRAQQRQAA